MTTLHLGPDNGTLRLHTGVEGKAARLGHDLVLSLADWTGEVVVKDGTPVSGELRAVVDSLRVDSGSGGAKGLSDKDKVVIRRNALGALRADSAPEIRFSSSSVTPVAGGFEVHGDLTIADRTRPFVVDVRVAPDGDSWALAARASVVQTDHEVVPYAAMLGALRLRDRVDVLFDAVVPRP